MSTGAVETAKLSPAEILFNFRLWVAVSVANLAKQQEDPGHIDQYETINGGASALRAALRELDRLGALEFAV